MAPWLILAPVSLDESMFTCAGVVFSEVAVAILSWQRYTAAGPRQLQARPWRRNQCAMKGLQWTGADQGGVVLEYIARLPDCGAKATVWQGLGSEWCCGRESLRHTTSF